MSVTVKIENGSYRNQPINGNYTLVQDFKLGATGGFITVSAPEYGKDKIRVKLTKSDYKIISGNVSELAGHDVSENTISENVVPVVEKTDAERSAEIGDRFDVLSEMAEAAINGNICSMVVVGPPGVGKSYEIEKKLDKYNSYDLLKNRPLRSQVIKGNMTAVCLYMKLHEFSEKGNVLVFDDCDSVLEDPISLNLLKGALDSSKRRRIFWGSDSNLLKNAGVPESFDFKASVIFITNIKFDAKRATKLGEHLKALQSRSHYIDLTINTTRDKFLRILQIAEKTDENGDSILFEGFGFTSMQCSEIIEYMRENIDNMRELSLRSAIKIAELVRIRPNGWRRLAEQTVMTNAL